MKKKQMIISAGIFFSMLFAGFYYLLFAYVANTPSSVTVYMNQVGLFQEEANSLQMQQSLKEAQIDSRILYKNELYALITGISSEEEEVIQQQEALKQLGYASIMKEVEVKDENLLNELHAGNLDPLIQWLNEQD